MYRLRRMYFDSIGMPDNRFSDLLVDVADDAGEPVDSIVWLRNGAGKTSMLSMLLALVLPDRRDFLATKTKDRSLEDLVQGSDTAHVAAEWVDTSGRVLLTGAVYEWDGRSRPRDYNSSAGRQRFRRMWWAITPDGSVEGSRLEELPFTLRSRGEFDLTRFRAHVKDLSTRGVNAVTVDDNIGEWHAALTARHFDPELFRYFTEVNATEGGLDKLFEGIKSPGAFVRYLLRFVGDEQRARPVRDLLADTAVEIAKRPTYLAERDFCSEAQSRLTHLDDAHRRVTAQAARRSEVRDDAATFKRALLDAATRADADAAAASEHHGGLEVTVRETRQLADAARRQRDEHLRLAALFRAQAATATLAGTGPAVERCEVDIAAWRAVDALVELDNAKAVLAARTDAVESATSDATPLVEQVRHARRRLAGALDQMLDDVDDRLEALAGQIEDAETARDDARSRRDDAAAAKQWLDTERPTLTGLIDRFERRRRTAETKGWLPAGEDLATAADRADADRARTATELGSVEAELGGLADRRTGLQEVRAERQAQAQEASAAASAVTAELDRLERRAATIADSPRLRDLAQADHVDLFADGADLLRRLREAVTQDEATILTLRAEHAEDERAIQALRAEGLLPPRRAVEQVVQALAEHGVSAHPGWRYLVEHTPADQHRRIIANVPEVVDGVVVYGDPKLAAAAIDGLDVHDLVVVASASALYDLDDATGAVVVGPAAALHDRDAAADELRRRDDAATARQGALAVLTDRRAADGRAAEAIGTLLADVPDDGIAGLRRRRDSAAAAAEEAAAKLADAEQAIADLEARGEELHRRSRHLDKELGLTDARVDGLVELRDEERDHVGEARARLAALPHLLAAAEEELTAAKQELRRAEADLDRLLGERRGLNGTRQQWAARRAVLGDAADRPVDVTVEAAETALEEAELQLRERFPEAELRRAVTEADRAVRKASARFERFPPKVRARADELAAGPTARDPELRAEEEAAAARNLQATVAAHSAAEAEADDAAAELAANTPDDRPRHAQELPADPVDRDDAKRRAAAADAEATRQQLVVGQRERERDAARDAARDATIRAGMLRDQAGLLRSVDAADIPAGDVPEDPEALRAAVADVANRLDEVEGAYSSAASGRSQRVEQLRNWANSDRFRDVAEDEHGQFVRRLRDMFRGDDVVDRVAPRAAEFAEDLVVRGQSILQQLNQVEEHKRNVVHRLADLVDDALSDLARASTLSELPADIGPWGGLRFLVVEPLQRPNREQIAVRVDDLVDRMVGAGKVEMDPVELLWCSTEAAVAEGFRANILKPAPDQPTARTPVEHMSKWSGGENLTASLVLFCVMAKLRSEKRTGSRAGATGGVIPLDNPLGKANYLPFLELQRRVAATNGAQLVFWTGLGDIGAVTAFPRVVAMHKLPSRTQPGRHYVRNNPQASVQAPPQDTTGLELAAHHGLRDDR